MTMPLLITPEPLSIAQFQEFGRFRNMIAPQGERFGAPPIEFYRDMIQQPLGTANIMSYSICRVEPRPFVIDTIEYHTNIAELILPLDGDILIHVAPATPPGVIPVEKMRVFRVPQGTLVILNAGVWHHAPYAVADQSINTLIGLPERTYANDCVVVELQTALLIDIR